LEGTAAGFALLEDLRTPSSPHSVARAWRQPGLVRIVGLAACLTLALIAWKLVVPTRRGRLFFKPKVAWKSCAMG
ncbi:MAG: hypothetical protein ACKO8Z_02950, partial [Prosthecobacter sp.]